jgi:3-hydroxybutyryl-CoA dehydratase
MRIRRYEDVQIGEKATFRKTITEADVWAFGAISGDFNPVHMDESFAKGTMFKTRIAHGMLTAALLDSTLTGIMGQGGIHITQEVKFLLPVKISDSVEVVSEVVEKVEAKNRLVIKTTITNQEGKVVLEGKAVTMMPRSK